MEYPPVAEQSYADAGAFPLADLRSQFDKQRLDFPPRYVAADRAAEDQFKRFPVPAPHEQEYHITVPVSNCVGPRGKGMFTARNLPPTSLRPLRIPASGRERAGVRLIARSRRRDRGQVAAARATGTAAGWCPPPAIAGASPPQPPLSWPQQQRKRRCPSCGKLHVGRPRQEPVCLTCNIRERAARDEHPAAIAVRFGIPRFLVEAVQEPDFHPTRTPSEVGDRRSWAIPEPIAFPKPLQRPGPDASGVLKRRSRKLPTSIGTAPAASLAVLEASGASLTQTLGDRRGGKVEGGRRGSCGAAFAPAPARYRPYRVIGS